MVKHLISLVPKEKRMDFGSSKSHFDPSNRSLHIHCFVSEQKVVPSPQSQDLSQNPGFHPTQLWLWQCTKLEHTVPLLPEPLVNDKHMIESRHATQQHPPTGTHNAFFNLISHQRNQTNLTNQTRHPPCYLGSTTGSACQAADGRALPIRRRSNNRWKNNKSYGVDSRQ